MRDINFLLFQQKIKDKLNGLSANDSKIGFVLQLGYFKATGKVYSEYNHDDKAFVGKLLVINLDGYNTDYSERTRLTHKLAILEMLGYKSFNKSEACWKLIKSVFQTLNENGMILRGD